MKTKGTKNLTFSQRLQIETLLNAKIKKQVIADTVGINIRTLYYELNRGKYIYDKPVKDFYGDIVRYKKITGYSSQIAQERYKIACTSKGRPLKIGNDYELLRYIEQRVKNDKLSACAVLGEIKYKDLPFARISKTTLYRYIEMGIIGNIRITNKPKKTYRKVIMKRAPKGTSIERRPLEIKQRNTFGHWEMDCVCGPTKTTLLVLSERLTRKEIIFKMNDQKSNSVIRCLNVLEKQYGKNFRKVFKSITVDNGSEFSNFAGMEKSRYGGKRTYVYYCHPYCSSERGTNERLNREIRRLIPKGTDLSILTNDYVKKVENWLNDYPREVLKYATSRELFDKQLQLLA